ncbi:YppE family protein [Peribacillus kribbensis]|uniref:YppE family protein n=1 Tax=Peribacillus kribbensis TaxID=356658 RepID=UPI0004090954|nr:YppE family protein [Peribacillus kribbensis]
MKEDLLTEQTKQLIELTDQIEEIFNTTKTEQIEHDFYETIKPFADRAFELSSNWKTAASEFIENKRPKHLHVQQIDQAAELISTSSIQAFFPKTSLKRFKSQLQSIRYTMETVLKQVEA